MICNLTLKNDRQKKNTQKQLIMKTTSWAWHDDPIRTTLKNDRPPVQPYNLSSTLDLANAVKMSKI